jgi:hypothetical protein
VFSFATLRVPSGSRPEWSVVYGKDRSMGVSVSLVLIAVGAVLTWAVSLQVTGVDLNAVGVILMVVGIVGLLLSLLFWSSWGGFGIRGGAGGSGGGQTTFVNDARDR